MPLPAWIDGAIETDMASIVRFARTLNRDFDAVKNAIEIPLTPGAMARWKVKSTA